MTPPEATFTTPDGPDLLAAAGLAAAILAAGRAHQWSDLEGALPDGVSLGIEQRDLLERHAALVRLLRRRRAGDDRTATVTAAVCTVCGRWLLLSGSPPARCPLTRGCGGTMTKARAAAISRPRVGSGPG